MVHCKKKVAKMLNYVNTEQPVRNHVDEEDRKTCPLTKSGQVRYATFINESGLYQLILSSKKETAKKFRRWVTSEVLPSLKKLANINCSMTQTHINLK